MTATPDSPASSNPRRIMSVLGPVPLADFGITDAHNHVWIEPVPGAAPDSPRLTERTGIQAELVDYRQAGGSAILDCQPGGCGRNAAVLAELFRETGVILVCATGFHRRRYYAPDYWLWQATPEQAAAYFTGELKECVAEVLPVAEELPVAEVQPQVVRAGFIKVACEAELHDTPLNALEGAAQAAAASGAAIAIHTEKGASAEAIFEFMLQHGVAARQVVLCHMDKRPDFGLHRALVQAGALLEYDTFYRPRYEPERNLWPLLEKMAADGLEHGLALATDIAEETYWSFLGAGPGLAGLIRSIRPRLEATGLPQAAVQHLLGGSITQRLAQ